MPKVILRFAVELTAVGQNFPLLIPLNAEDVALRVLCRYDVTEDPPPPRVLVVTVKTLPDPSPLNFTMRNFQLVPANQSLPDDFVKFIGSVPFTIEKNLVNIIETQAVTPITKDHPMHPEHPKQLPTKPATPPKPEAKPKPKPPAPKHSRLYVQTDAKPAPPKHKREVI